MPAKKKSVNTPLHLLEQLANTLVDHLDKACQLALQDAESTLGKLEKQRGKTQERMAKARTRLDERRSRWSRQGSGQGAHAHCRAGGADGVAASAPERDARLHCRTQA